MSNEPRSELARRVTRRRLELGLTQDALGERLGVSPQSVQQWERGATVPRSTRLRALAEALETTRAWLVGEVAEDQSSVQRASMSVPVLSWQALARRVAGEDACSDTRGQIMVVPDSEDSQFISLEVEQDAMVSPNAGVRSYPPGTLLVVAEREPRSLPARVIAAHDSGALTFRELVEDSGQRLLRPMNPQYPVLDGSEWRIIGTVVSTQIPE